MSFPSIRFPKRRCVTNWFLCQSMVASQETYGTLGAIVRSRTGNRQVGFLTNRHVAVDLDYPNQKMFHPLPPSLGPGVYLGAVERATSFITNDLWYGIFAGTNADITRKIRGNRNTEK
ncbi:protein NARROW LEAF 1-like isoform X2 [Humulus lupulus]|uniref:protein NARROW LEAF 1-like isoform X2 n=1 Tax=Humulus lupulus TaxID=3486 RepID=UPI002B417D56|nr:protein NARROW LEAF 1-like isoform X2 [Humulus lupulus]